MTSKAKAIIKDEEVQQNPDPHIDQDYPGFPHLPSTKESITPKTATEKKLSGIIQKPHKKKLSN